jgi:hypothetical protein
MNEPSRPASEIRKIAFVGDYLPRKCGIATFTHDMYASVVGRFPEAHCSVVPVNEVDIAANAIADDLYLRCLSRAIDFCFPVRMKCRSRR